MYIINSARIKVSQVLAECTPSLQAILSGSDIIYLDAAGQDIIVLNSAEAIDDILEKRSAISSSR
jgi:hypothetical protein